MTRGRLLLDLLARPRGHRYGPHRSQRADLYVPPGAGAHPVMVVIHGGSWHRRYGKVVMRGLLGELTRRGWAVWNIEYRRLGDGGGWPATFEDVAAAVDHLAAVRAPLDLDRVSVLGHSAGGQLALWAAGRGSIAPGMPGAAPTIAIERAISQAGVCDLAGAHRLWRGGVVEALMGGGPDDVPERYAAGDPLALLPLPMPVLLFHGASDATVSIELSRSYARAAALAGGDVELVEIEGAPGAHRAHVDPRGPAWAAVTGWLEASAAR